MRKVWLTWGEFRYFGNIFDFIFLEKIKKKDSSHFFDDLICINQLEELSLKKRSFNNMDLSFMTAKPLT